MTSQKHAQSPTDGQEHAASTHISTYGSASTWGHTRKCEEEDQWTGRRVTSGVSVIELTTRLHSLKSGPLITRHDCSTVTSLTMLLLQGAGVYSTHTPNAHQTREVQVSASYRLLEIQASTFEHPSIIYAS